MLISTLQEAVDTGSLACVPSDYIIPEQDRPTQTHGSAVSSAQLPVIDLAGVTEGGERRGVVVDLIRQACLEWGFFQVVNHPVPVELVRRMQAAAHAFFQLPVQEKQRCAVMTESQTLGSQGYGSKFKAKDGAASDWGDQLRHRTLPVEARQLELWPANPANYRETEEEYVEELDNLTRLLYELLAEGLGLHPAHLSDMFRGRDQQVMLVNYYPPCPQPELTMGIQKHSDIGLITVLWQDETSGLQVSKDGAWIPVVPVEDAFVINLGDQMEILTNGKYQSVEHRVLVNSEKPRMSIATFTSPQDNVVIAPIPELVKEFKAPQYNQITYGTYRTSFFAKGCAGKEHLKAVTVK